MISGGGEDPGAPSAPDAHEPSAPWERPRRWEHDPEDSTSFDDLMARLRAEGIVPEARRRRRSADETSSDTEGGVPASELIAALGGAPAAGAPEAGAPEAGAPEVPAAAEAGDAGGAEPGEAADAGRSDAADAGDAAESAGAAKTVNEEPDSQRTVETAAVAAGSGGADEPWQAVLTALGGRGGGAGPHDAATPGGPSGGPPPGGPPSDGPPPDDGPPAHGDPPRPGWMLAARSFVAVLAVLLLVVAGTEWVIKARANATLSDNEISALDPSDTNISSPTVTDTAPPTGQGDAQSAAAPAKHYTAENILLIGSDTRAKPEDAALGGANDAPGGSDVIMVAHLAADRSHVTIVSIPRDTYIEAPTCKAWDFKTGKVLDEDYQSPYTLWRINSAYAAGGPACTVKAVQQLTGLRIDRVIVIDFAGFASMVDALGGITVDACHPIIDHQLGTVLPVAGPQHIDGRQALNLVRARKVVGDTTSDLARIRRQQKVLSTMLRQVTSAGVLLNPVKLDSVLQAFVHNVQTDNVSLDDLLDLAQSLGNLEPSRVTFFTLPTTPDPNDVGLHPTKQSELIWQALRADEPLPGEVTEPVTPTPTSTSTSASTSTPVPTPTPSTDLITRLVTSTPTVPQHLSVAPGDVDLQVVNVAGRGGVATRAMNALVPLGFRLSGPDLLLVHGQDQRGITVQYSPPNRAAALTVAAAVPGATLTPTSGLGSKVRLMLGSSFDGTVRRVSVGEPVPSALSTTAKPVTSTVVSTRVTTPAPPPAPTTSTPSTSPSAPEGESEVSLPPSDITSVNAGNAGCI